MDSSEVITLRPSWRQHVRSSLLRFAPAIVIYVVIQLWLASHSGAQDSLFALWSAVAIVILAAADAAYRINTVVRVTPEWVSIEPPLILRKVVSRKSVGGVSLRGVFSYRGAKLYGVVYDDHGRSIATLPEGIWDEKDLRRLQAILGSRDHSISYLTAADLGKEFRGALTVTRYAGWVIAAGVVFLIVVLASLQTRVK